MKHRILTINPGSTSTKIALYEEEQEVLREELSLKPQSRPAAVMLDELEARRAAVQDFLRRNGIGGLDIIVARGGSMNGVGAGAYQIDEHVLTILERAPRTQHRSSLAAFIAHDLAAEWNIPAIFYDAPSASEADELLHYTGIPNIRRWASDHCLNSKAVAREVAAELGKSYVQCNLLVAHLGGGITLSFHSGGRMIDTVEDDAGPMSLQRAGRIPSYDLIEMCYSGRYTRREMQRKLRGEGGLLAYLGTSDSREVERRIAAGDRLAEQLYRYMAYQVAKSIGELSVANSGKLDAIVLTGGMAHSTLFTGWITERVRFLAPVKIIPGEREMLALAQGGLRVLRGEEPVKQYRWLPSDCSSLEEVRQKYCRGDTSMNH